MGSAEDVFVKSSQQGTSHSFLLWELPVAQPCQISPRPGGLPRQSQLTGYSAVFQPGCLIHLWGRLAGLPLLLLPEADVSARDQREGNPCSQRFPGPSGSTEPSPGDPPLCTLCHPSAAKNHLQSLEYFWTGPGKINYGNSLPYSEK